VNGCRTVLRCFEAFTVLAAVQLALRIVGLTRFLRFLQRVFGSLAATRQPDDDRRLPQLVAAYHAASRLYPFPVNCLPRSLSIYIMARWRHLPVKLCIGVKKFPFISHAWVSDEHCLFPEEEALIQTLQPIWRLD
jgi:hypothetical protein